MSRVLLGVLLETRVGHDCTCGTLGVDELFYFILFIFWTPTRRCHSTVILL